MPVAGAVLALGEIGMVSGELGELVRGRHGVGGQANAKAGSGQLVGVRLPIKRHRKAAFGTRRRVAVVGRLRGTLEHVGASR